MKAMSKMKMLILILMLMVMMMLMLMLMHDSHAGHLQQLMRVKGGGETGVRGCFERRCSRVRLLEKGEDEDGQYNGNMLSQSAP
jgi:hypothetical protein